MPTYNPKDVVVTVNGLTVTGYGKGADAIKTAYDSDSVEADVGVTGEGAFIESNDRRAVLTLKLMQTSTFNDILSGLHAGNVEFIIAIDDTRGNSVAAGASCRVQKLPDWQRGDELQDIEWPIRIIELIELIGGTP